MNKTRLNFLVDLALFVSMISLAGLGLILEFLLPPGSGDGHGGAAGPFARTLLGLSRHEWGDLHFKLAVILLLLLAVHLVLHWPWIKCRFQALFPRKNSGGECGRS